MNQQIIDARIEKLTKIYNEYLEKPMNTSNQATASSLLAEICHLKHFSDNQGEYTKNHEKAETTQETAYQSAEKSSAQFCHDKCNTELDTEMDRILKYGDDYDMKQLSRVLSDHFGDLAIVYPKLYTKLLNELTKIK